MPSPSKPRSVLAPDRRPSVSERRPDQRTLAHRDPHSPEAIRAARGWDVRLVPIAGAMWCGVASVVALRHWWAIAIVPAACIAAVGIAAGCAAILPNRRTTIVRAIAAGAYTAAATVVCSAVAAVAAYVRVWRIDRNPLVRGVKAAPNRPGTHRLPTPPTSSTTSRLDLTISGSPRPTRNGGVHVPVDVDGLGDVPLFIPPTQLRGHPAPGHPAGVTSGADPREQILAWQPGTRLSITATVDASDRAGLVPITLTARDPILGGAGGGVEVSEPTGLLALTAAIRRGLAVAADGLPADGGTIIPGMVVGDTSMHPIASRQEFIATGLSHLTAVSGSNVAVVTGTVVVACAALGLRKRARFVAAALALLGFVLVVGPEPSVLRAAIMGSVGLVAVVTSKWSDILAALSVATIVLCVAAPGVVTGYAFALSVAATAGIVVVSPWWARVILRRYAGWLGRHWDRAPTEAEAMLVRLVCVTVAADLATIPIIVHMSGEVSLVAVPANLAVAWVVPLVTVAGLLAAPICAGVVALGGPTWIAEVALFPAWPGAWWVTTVAGHLADAPRIHTSGGTVWAIAALVGICGGIGCIVWRRYWRWWRWSAAVAVAALAVAIRCGAVSLTSTEAPTWVPPSSLDLSGQAVAVVPDDAAALAAGTSASPPEVVVVTACGKPHDRPSYLPTGQPVVYPCADHISITGIDLAR